MLPRINVAKLPPPSFYDASQTQDRNYRPDWINIGNAAEKWRALFRIEQCPLNIVFLYVDGQNDFTFPSGSLYVAGRSGTGGMDAQRNFAEFSYGYIRLGRRFIFTKDHHPFFAIYFPTGHIDRDGNNPKHNTVISYADYITGVYVPSALMVEDLDVPEKFLREHFTYYCRYLEEKYKEQLYLWNLHCVNGTDGQNLSSCLIALGMFHVSLFGSPVMMVDKGMSPYTEHYSVFSAKLTHFENGNPITNAQKNIYLIDTLAAADMVIVGGLASSHCVAESIRDYLSFTDPKKAKKVYLLKDCTAAVVIPGVVDYTDAAEGYFEEFRDRGVNIVDSKTPIEDWPNLPFIGYTTSPS